MEEVFMLNIRGVNNMIKYEYLIVVKTTVNVHIFSLLKIVPAQPLCLFLMSLIALEIGFALLVILLYLSI
jgi:hypothetical protein